MVKGLYVRSLQCKHYIKETVGSFWIHHFFPMGSLLHRPQADPHTCESVPGPRVKEGIIPRILLFAPRINSRAKEAWQARPWDQMAHRDGSLIRLRGGTPDGKAADAPGTMNMPEKAAGFSQNFPDSSSLLTFQTLISNGNLVHIRITFPVSSQMQDTEKSAMRSSPCPRVAHSPREESKL